MPTNPEPLVKNFMVAMSFCLFLLTILAMFFIFNSCDYVPTLAKDVEDYATDNAVKVEVSREALLKAPNLNVDVRISNKSE